MDRIRIIPDQYPTPKRPTAERYMTPEQFAGFFRDNVLPGSTVDATLDFFDIEIIDPEADAANRAVYQAEVMREMGCWSREEVDGIIKELKGE